MSAFSREPAIIRLLVRDVVLGPITPAYESMIAMRSTEEIVVRLNVSLSALYALGEYVIS